MVQIENVVEDSKQESDMETSHHNKQEGTEGVPGLEQKSSEPTEEKMENLSAEISESAEQESQGSAGNSEIMEGDDSFPPKVKSAKVDVAEGVTKQVIKEGRGEQTPSRHSTCFFHYKAWTERTMHKFEDTWQEGAPAEVLVGHEKQFLRGLAIGVASMKAGEHALLHVGWKLAYGEEGNFSFPNVPPKADVIYEVELIGFEEAKEGRPRGEMTVEERIRAADRRRVDGNELFKEDKLEEAIQQYEMALAYMGDDFMFQLFGKYKDMADSVKLPCHLNMAASLLKLEKYDEAIGQCTIVLAEDKANTKALFRRGRARSALGQTDAAKEDFKKVKDLVPGDKAVLRELRKIAEAERELHLKQKELYKGLFARAPPPPQKDPWYSVILQWFISIFRYCLRLLHVNKIKTS